jgi:hypothetical protein
MIKHRINSIHREIIQGHVSDRADADEMLLWMVLLHTHTIHLKTACLDDAPGVAIVQPLTQRASAAIIADLWSDRSDREKTSAEYWYRVYQLTAPYETIGDVPKDRADRIELLRQALQVEPLVSAVVPG